MKKYLIAVLALALSTAFAQSPKRADADNSNMNAEIFYGVLLAELARIDGLTDRTQNTHRPIV
jgi:thiamine transporter ThiT